VLPGSAPFAAAGDDVGVLLCHGFTGCPQALRPWAEHLAAAGRTVRLPLLPGHGTTWQQLARTGWDDWVGALRAELDDLSRCTRTVVVAGLSNGGALALRLAQLAPEQVDALVLVNPAVLLRDRRLAALPVLRRVLPSIPGVHSDIKRPGVVEVAYDRTPLRALASMVAGWADVVADLPTVHQPLLLARSAQDHVVPAESSRVVLERVASTDVTELVLADSYHVATLDNDAPALFAAADAFVERVAPAAQPASARPTEQSR
jgi:carboxylesterase